MNAKKPTPGPKGCEAELKAVKDTMVLLSGKWKIQIVGALTMNGPMRFMDLRRDVEGIAAKMLSKELYELEQNELVKRTVMPTKPITVEYELTKHGKTLETVINAIRMWGVEHRKYLFRKK